MPKKQLEKISSVAKTQAEQIIADQQLPIVLPKAIGNAIEIGIADKAQQPPSNKTSANKRRSRGKIASIDSGLSKSAIAEEDHQCSPIESTLKASYANLRQKKRDYKAALKQYRQLRGGMDYLKTPKTSDEEN